MTYFHIESINDKFVLIDPAGRPFYMRGANHYGDGSYLPLNRQERYGSVEAWRESVKRRHLDWGFNYLPSSIGPSEISTEAQAPNRRADGKTGMNAPCHRTPEWSAQDFVDVDMPFTAMVGYPKQYMAGQNMPDVFSQQFREEVDVACQKICEPLCENKNLIGYFFCHNPPWHPHGTAFFDWVHQIVDSDNEAKRVWVRLMHRIYGTVERWQETYGVPIKSFDELNDYTFPLSGKMSASNLYRDKVAFMKLVCEQWYKVYSESIRKYDPNHLVLGDRNTLHLQPLSDWAQHIMAKYIDVLSVNVMGPMNTVLREMEQITTVWNGPILIADTGAGIYNGEWPKSAYMCTDVEEFSEVYSAYVRLGIEHPQLIGMGWCGYYETPCARSGLVDSRNDEPDMVKIHQIKKWNDWFDDRYMK